MVDVPTTTQFFVPTVHALRRLGGSASVDELYDALVEAMALSEAQLEARSKPDAARTMVRIRMGWARTYLKKGGFVTNSGRGVWALTPKGKAEDPDVHEVVERARTEYADARAANEDPDSDRTEEESEAWQDEALTALKAMPFDAFERLCQRILREAGFVEVEVLGRTGDKGIDGRGILRLQQLVSFHVHFQCKRYQTSVGAPEIRDFRGAMVGRSDKGLFLTTGTFTSAAREEATRDGAPPIDLIDGPQLVELLKELELGIHTELVEVTKVDAKWFEAL